MKLVASAVVLMTVSALAGNPYEHNQGYVVGAKLCADGIWRATMDPGHNADVSAGMKQGTKTSYTTFVVNTYKKAREFYNKNYVKYRVKKMIEKYSDGSKVHNIPDSVREYLKIDEHAAEVV